MYFKVFEIKANMLQTFKKQIPFKSSKNDNCKLFTVILEEFSRNKVLKRTLDGKRHTQLQKYDYELPLNY